MVLLIDNYDSFTYNLYQYLGEILDGSADVRVVRNDRIDLAGIRAISPTHLVLSPGPGRPEDAGILPDAIRAFAGEIPILGICLGHQAIGQVFGGRVVRAPGGPVHGKPSTVHVATGCPLFHGLPPVIEAGRYHSLIVDRESLPDELRLTAETSDGTVMGLAHRDLPVFGVQFHPESILTPHGMRILQNFLAVRIPEGGDAR
jgi:anthranilate synthase component II